MESVVLSTHNSDQLYHIATAHSACGRLLYSSVRDAGRKPQAWSYRFELGGNQRNLHRRCDTHVSKSNSGMSELSISSSRPGQG